jgi:hypothetical protein
MVFFTKPGNSTQPLEGDTKMTIQSQSQIQDMREQLDRLLMAQPETGEAWADICLLEQQIIDAEANLPANEYVRDNAQFGVGA